MHACPSGQPVCICLAHACVCMCVCSPVVCIVHVCVSGQAACASVCLPPSLTAAKSSFASNGQQCFPGPQRGRLVRALPWPCVFASPSPGAPFETARPPRKSVRLRLPVLFTPRGQVWTGCSPPPHPCPSGPCSQLRPGLRQPGLVTLLHVPSPEGHFTPDSSTHTRLQSQTTGTEDHRDREPPLPLPVWPWMSPFTLLSPPSPGQGAQRR